MNILMFTLIFLLLFFLDYLLVKAVMNCFKENPQELNPSEDQKNIRGSWKQSFLLCNLASLLYLLAVVVREKELEWPYTIGVTLFAILTSLIAAYAMAYFAFKKFGTKWICLSVFLTPIITVLEMVAVLQGSLSELLFCTIMSIPTVYFWIHSINLYKLNRSLKKKRKQDAMQTGRLIEGNC